MELPAPGAQELNDGLTPGDPVEVTVMMGIQGLYVDRIEKMD